MEQTLSDIPGVACYLDDFIITGKTEKEHLTNLQETLQRLKDSGFQLRESKCSFLQTNVSYLGHVIDKEGIRLVADKIEAINNMPLPTDKKELRLFLGMVNYYDRFLPGLVTKCAPLDDFLQKDKKYCWNRKHTSMMNQH